MNKCFLVVPYIGTWIETSSNNYVNNLYLVVPYIGTWIETGGDTASPLQEWTVVPYIGTWIETILR